MYRVLCKTFNLSALVAISSFCAHGGIRPSFYLNACTWNATEIVVLAPRTQAGTFLVIEVIKGELAPGESLELTGLARFHADSARLRELSKAEFEGVPPVAQSNRLIVFLRRPGALPEYNPRPDLPVDTSGWESANQMGDLRTSAVWIQDGVTYGFLQTTNPGPTHLTGLRVSETEIRRSIQSVLQLREAMDHAEANADPVERSRQFASLVHSNNEIARMSALQKLARGGTSETNVLVELLTDQSLLGLHQDIVASLAGKGVAGVRFAEFLNEETTYWSKACRTLHPGGWNSMPSPDAETARNHYTRAYALLKAIHELSLPETMQAVRNFAAVWSTCPPLEEREKTNQITESLQLLLNTDHFWN